MRVATPPTTPIMPSGAVSNAELGERGRGLALVQATADRFEYQRTPNEENIWIIEKSFPTRAIRVRQRRQPSPHGAVGPG